MNDGFERFWAAYPKKRSKGDAYKAWCATASKRPDTAQIIKALTVLKASQDWMKDGGQFIPYPSTWLRAWGWDDVPEVDLQGVVNGKMWWETVTGVDLKAAEFGVKEGEYGSRAEFRQAVFRAAGHNVTPMTDAVDVKMKAAGG